MEYSDLFGLLVLIAIAYFLLPRRLRRALARDKWHWEDTLVLGFIVSLIAALALSGLPVEYQGAIDSTAVVAVVVIGKTFGRRLHLRSRFWQSQLTAGEWAAMVILLLLLYGLFFTPVVHSVGRRRAQETEEQHGSIESRNASSALPCATRAQKP